MDYELLVALWVLWVASTLCLFACAFMWLMNEGEAFHPHSIDMEWRHDFYQVVKSNTKCKVDFAVKSVSEFIAARGSSSEKYLTTLIVIVGITGFLGTTRWYAVGDASILEATLSHIGFFSLLIIAVFEVDVSSESFLEVKVLITSWFLEILHAEKHLKFRPHVHSPQLLEFIRESKDLRHLFEEDDGKIKFDSSFFSLKKFQFSLHVIGAMLYSVCVTAAIILNEINEEKVAWITGVSFVMFSALGYFSGAYLSIPSCCRLWVLLWNPFMGDPDFLDTLQKAVNEYAMKHGPAPDTATGTDNVVTNGATDGATNGATNSRMLLRRSPRKKASAAAAAAVVGPISDAEIAATTKRILTSRRYYFVRKARENPKQYLRVLSHVYMTVELVALMTPMIAMGIQWLTALCPGSPMHSVFLVLSMMWHCLVNGDYECLHMQESCILHVPVV
jgi:hypothetical protein